MKQLKNLESAKGSTISAMEDRYKQREKELEQMVEEKDAEIEEMI